MQYIEQFFVYHAADSAPPHGKFQFCQNDYNIADGNCVVRATAHFLDIWSWEALCAFAVMMNVLNFVARDMFFRILVAISASFI